MFCGSRTRTGGFCRNHCIPGRKRCRLHGGRYWPVYGPRDQTKQNEARRKKQALFKSLGIPWYGGHPPTNLPKLRSKLKTAEDTIVQTLEVLGPEPQGELTEQSPVGDILRQAMRESLLLGLRTVRLAGKAIDAHEADPERMPVHMKLLTLGNTTAMAISKLGMRAIEGELQVRKFDRLGELLQLIAQQKGDKAP